MEKKWKSNAKKENEIYFQNILNVLDKKFDLKYPSERVSKNEGLPPEEILNTFIGGMAYVDNKRDKVYKTVEKTGTYENKIKIGNETSCEYFNNDKNRVPDYLIKLMKEIDHIFYIAEQYYVFKYMDNAYKCQYGEPMDFNEKNKMKILSELDGILKNQKHYNNMICNYSLKDNSISYYLSPYIKKANYWLQNTHDEVFKIIVNIVKFENY